MFVLALKHGLVVFLRPSDCTRRERKRLRAGVREGRWWYSQDILAIHHIWTCLTTWHVTLYVHFLLPVTQVPTSSQCSLQASCRWASREPARAATLHLQPHTYTPVVVSTGLKQIFFLEHQQSPGGCRIKVKSHHTKAPQGSWYTWLVNTGFSNTRHLMCAQAF